MKPNIVHSLWEKGPNDFKRLDGPIQVLVIDGVLIMPQSRRRTRDLVSNEEDPIVTGIRFSLVYCRACPGHDAGLHSHGRAKR